MRTLGVILGIAALVGMIGCTHRSLTRNTVLTTNTIMEIQYRSVLANLAQLSLHPEALPNHVNLAEGVVQINDQAGFGQSGGFTSYSGVDFGIEQFGPSGRRQISEQWGTDATTDPERLYDLQSLYRVALGLPPLAPPNSIEYIRKQNQKKKSSDDASDSSNGDSSDDNDSRRVPLEVLLTDVPPPGWYHIGCKKDVPKNACYVGHWGHQYAWVMADGMPQLARFTATALLVIKLKPGEQARNRGGLAVTGGQ
jgi:hypothetical protein